MRMRMTSEESLALIQPTVGWEGELHQIVFVVVRDKKIVFDDNVLKVFESKEHRISCENDYTTDNRKEVNEVAKANRLTVSNQYKCLHILEFVTSPTKKMEEIEKQLTEIARLEEDLIRYIFFRKEENELKTLLCIKDWIDDYNRRFPNAQLTQTDATKEMYILMDYSITQMKESVKKFSLESLQKNLKHSVQYNFVASLGKKMGSQLVGLLDVTNKERNKDKIKNLFAAENNSENACQWIRNILGSGRKFAKLEGFFFLLSMRIVTETSYVFLSETSSEKNKYFFFLKTKLSELLLSLSERDKNVLEKISTCGEKEKNQFLALIAGSYEALTASFQINQIRFTVKQVLESALGWEKNDICDLLPNTPTKDIVIPFEPEDPQIHHKLHELPFIRVVLENRSAMDKTTSESMHEMQEMLKHSADLSMTSFLHKQYGTSRAESANSEFKEINSGVIIENNMNVASNIIERFRTKDRNYKITKLQLDKLLSHTDKDITLKQINYLFIKMKNQDPDIDKMLIELFAEKIKAFFPPVLNANDKSYLKYVATRYILSTEIPEIAEYLNFVDKLNSGFLQAFDVSLLNKNKEIELSYSVKPGVDINENDKKRHNALYYACKFRLIKLIDTLLQQKAVATSDDFISCFDQTILTKELAEKLMDAGADAGRVLCYFAEKNEIDSIKKLIEIIGKEKLNNALEDYVFPRPHQRSNYELLKPFLVIEPTAALSHSVMFPTPTETPVTDNANSSLTKEKKYER